MACFLEFSCLMNRFSYFHQASIEPLIQEECLSEVPEISTHVLSHCQNQPFIELQEQYLIDKTLLSYDKT